MMPSPHRDWGYDVSTIVFPELGTLADLREAVKEADRRASGFCSTPFQITPAAHTRGL